MTIIRSEKLVTVFSPYFHFSMI